MRIIGIPHILLCGYERAGLRQRGAGAVFIYDSTISIFSLRLPRSFHFFTDGVRRIGIEFAIPRETFLMRTFLAQQSGVERCREFETAQAVYDCGILEDRSCSCLSTAILFQFKSQSRNLEASGACHDCLPIPTWIAFLRCTMRAVGGNNNRRSSTQMDQPRIKFLGAAGTVTGSKFRVSYNGTEILLDLWFVSWLKRAVAA